MITDSLGKGKRVKGQEKKQGGKIGGRDQSKQDDQRGRRDGQEWGGLQKKKEETEFRDLGTLEALI